MHTAQDIVNRCYSVTIMFHPNAWGVNHMARNKKYQDFRNLQDYRLALLVMRKFAPAKFAASAGYDLRKWRNLDDISKKQGATLRKYYRETRPLLVYGYVARKPRLPKNSGKRDYQKKLDSQYKALYGIKPLAGINKIPLPLDKNNKPIPVIFKRDFFGNDVAAVVITSGIQMIRLTWEQMGYGWDDISPENIAHTMAQIWQKYKPDYVGTIAGISRVKREGHIKFFNSSAQVASQIAALQTTYGAAALPASSGNSKDNNNNTSNWLDGLELYFFYPPSDKKGRTHPKAAALKQWRADEKKRYDDRRAITKKITGVSTSIRRLKNERLQLISGLKRVSKIDRMNILMNYQPIYDKKMIDYIAKRDNLTTQLHLTKGF